FRRRDLLGLLRHQVRHAATPDAGGGLVAMAGGVRLEKADAVGARIGAAPGYVPAFPIAVVAQQAAPNRIDGQSGVDVREEARVNLLGGADLSHLDILDEEERAVGDPFERAPDVLRDLSGR